MEVGPLQHIWQEFIRIANLPVVLDNLEISLGPFGKLTTIAKDSPDVRLQIRQRLRGARNPTFLSVVNSYLHRAQDIAQQHGHRKLVVILDNLDRLQETLLPGNALPADELLFLGQATPLLGVQCHIIYTVRLALVRTQAANLGERYGQIPLIVPMVPVRHPDGTPHEAGMAKLREVIERRLNAADTDFRAFSSIAEVDQLCRASGGHLRELMTLVQNTCAQALATHPELPLTAADVGAAINNLGAQRRALAGGYAAVLRQVSQTHRLDEIPVDVRQVLLRHRLVHEYFSSREYWYDVSPLLQEEVSGNGD
jgi:hypothetical protein